MKQATIALKRARLDTGEEADYAFTPEPTDPYGPYLPNHETSDESDDRNSEWRLRSKKGLAFIFFAAIINIIIKSSYNLNKIIVKSKTKDFKNKK